MIHTLKVHDAIKSYPWTELILWKDKTSGALYVLGQMDFSIVLVDLENGEMYGDPFEFQDRNEVEPWLNSKGLYPFIGTVNMSQGLSL